MEMDFEPNSHKYHMDKVGKMAQEAVPTEEKKFDKVIEGEVKVRKRSLFRRFVDIFLTENIGDVKTYLMYDVLVPAIKENIADMINAGVGMLFFGEASRRPRKPGVTTGSRINYGGYFAGQERKEKLPAYSRSKIAHNYDDLAFDSRGEAEIVLDCMIDAVQNYGRVSVSDFYDFAGMSKMAQWTDEKYGWTDLQGAKVSGSPTRGYYIDLPKCTALD